MAQTTKTLQKVSHSILALLISKNPKKCFYILLRPNLSFHGDQQSKCKNFLNDHCHILKIHFAYFWFYSICSQDRGVFADLKKYKNKKCPPGRNDPVTSTTRYLNLRILKDRTRWKINLDLITRWKTSVCHVSLQNTIFLHTLPACGPTSKGVVSTVILLFTLTGKNLSG